MKTVKGCAFRAEKNSLYTNLKRAKFANALSVNPVQFIGGKGIPMVMFANLAQENLTIVRNKDGNF